MTCDEVATSEIVEKYLLNELSEGLRDSFEQHYFECARCFGLLQTYRQMQAELARTRSDALVEAPKAGWVWRWAWAPALAVVVLAVGVTLLVRPSNPPGPAAPTEAPGPAAPTPTPPARPSIEQLARFDPPPYSPGRLRGAPDEATARFQESMKAYARGDFQAAVPGLAAASKLDPDAPHIQFFLGISRLMIADDRSSGLGSSGARESQEQRTLAIEALRRTIALGDSPYRENAHFYLAKAYLKTGNVDGAVKELTDVVQTRGERAAEAERILRELRERK